MENDREEFVPLFDVTVSPNFGYVYTLDDVSEVIQHYETYTTSAFVVQKSDVAFGKNNNVPSKSIIKCMWYPDDELIV